MDYDIDIEREDFTQEAMKYLRSSQHSDQTFTNNYGNLQASYEPDSLNLFTLGIDFLNQDVDMTGIKHTYMQSADGKDVWAYDAKNRYLVNSLSVSVATDYQHTFGKPLHNLILSYKYGYGKDNTDSYMRYYNPVGMPYDLQNQRNYTSEPTHEHMFQIDYTNPFDNVHTLEAGAKMIIRRNKSDDRSYPEFAGGFSDEPQNRVALEQKQDIYALYSAYTLRYKRFGLKAGLRYEHTRMGVDFLTDGYENYMSRLNDFVPDAMLSWKLSDMSNIRLTCQMRINRPAVGYLNPYRDTENPTAVSFGNPELNSETTNSIGLGYSSFGNVFSWDISLKYSMCNNGIVNYSYIKDGITYHTYGNVQNSRIFSSWGYVMAAITPKMRLTMNFGLSYRDYQVMC